MRFTAIDTSAWEELKKSIDELALCMRENFGTKPELTYYTMGMYAEY